MAQRGEGTKRGGGWGGGGRKGMVGGEGERSFYQKSVAARCYVLNEQSTPVQPSPHLHWPLDRHWPRWLQALTQIATQGTKGRGGGEGVRRPAVTDATADHELARVPQITYSERSHGP